MAIPVIDLFAGPGGMGEGFSSVLDAEGKRIFDIKLSIEKDEHAHKTLLLRSFLRQFPVGQFPKEYYEMLRENDLKEREKKQQALYKKYKSEFSAAEKEAWLCELGGDKFPPEFVDYRIRKALNKQNDWIIIGGPPCQAYSLVGRSRNRGLSEEDTRVFLYREYLRIIAKHHPKVFVMENVKGLLSAELNGEKIFDWIKADLKNPGRVFPGLNAPKYKIYSFVKQPEAFDNNGSPVYEKDSDFLIHSEEYGVPQKRHRVILLGVREDIEVKKFKPLQPSEEVTLEQIIKAFPAVRSGIGRELDGLNEKGKNKYRQVVDSDSVWRKVVTDYFARIKQEQFRKCSLKLKGGLAQGSNYIELKLNEPENPLFNWYRDSKLKGIIQHETRTHLKEDIGRYLFSSLYLQENGEFPKLKDYPDWLLPNHKNAKTSKFADRFRTQKPNQPATTVTSHISKDGHYFIHYDPTQCRSLTVREAARIQTFPDNYFFCGSRTQQYHQVGNAVPPYLAKQLADIVKKIFE